MIEKAQSPLQIITGHITVHAALSAQDLKLKAAEQKSLIDFIESCVEKMQPQLEDSVTPKSESRYRITQTVTRFSDAKLPKLAEVAPLVLFFGSVCLKKKNGKSLGLQESREMEKCHLCDSLCDTELTPEFRILLADMTDTCHQLNQASL